MSEVFKINDIDYECEFKLSNPDGQEISYTKSALRGMNLVDDLFNPFMDGEVTVANPYDYMEDKYFLRGDGRDEFLIKFKPKESKNEDDEFEMTFVVIDDKDRTNPNTRAENFKTLYLISKDAIPFLDIVPYGKKYSGKVGDILKDIFKEVLGDDAIDEENWESGEGEIEYIPPGTFRYMDVIYKLVKYFYGKDDETFSKGFINYDEKTKKYQLKLLSKIFKDNKKYEMEAFGMGDLVTDIGFENPNNPPSGPKVGEYIGQLRHLGYSTPMYTWTSEYFINALVFVYDNVLGQLKFKKLKFEDIREKWEKIFVKPFKTVQGKPQKFAIKNKTTEGKFKRYSFAIPNLKTASELVEAEMMNAMTFYNLQLAFINIGTTYRKAGKFIDIFSPKKLEKKAKPLKSEEKILGRWFVTKIEHTFFADLYTNKIYATKTYIGPNSKLKENVE